MSHNKFEFIEVSQSLAYTKTPSNSFIIVFSSPDFNPVAYFVAEESFDEYFNEDEGWDAVDIGAIKNLSHGGIHRRNKCCTVIKI